MINLMLSPPLSPIVIMSSPLQHADTLEDNSQEAGARPTLFIQQTLAAVCDRPFRILALYSLFKWLDRLAVESAEVVPLSLPDR